MMLGQLGIQKRERGGGGGNRKDQKSKYQDKNQKNVEENIGV